MYFLYFDESGNPGPDPVQRFFTLAALAARAEHCLSIQQRLVDLKLKFFPTVQPHEIEIKGRNLIHGKGFFEDVRLETREAILREIYGLLESEPLWLFVTVLDKNHPALQRLGLLPDDVYRYTYKNLIRRVDLFLSKEANPGLVFIDSMASSIRSSLRDARLINFHREYLQEMARSGRETSVVEYPVFVQGQFFAAIQLADVCAYQVFYAFQTVPNASGLEELNPRGEQGLEVVLRMLQRSSGLERLP